MHIFLLRPEGKWFVVIYGENTNAAFVLLLEDLSEVCHAQC